jgi:hypothetical protein
MKIGSFHRPTAVIAILDANNGDVPNLVVRCPLCNMTNFTQQATDRHNHGTNAVFVAGNASRFSYLELQSNHNDCWGHYDR